MEAADNDVDLSSTPKSDQESSMNYSKVEQTPESNGVVIGEKANHEPVVPTIDTIDTIGTMDFPGKPQEDEVAGDTDQVMDTDEAMKDDPVVDIKVSDGKDGDKVGEEEEKEQEEVAEAITESKVEAEAVTVSKEEPKNITVSKVDVEDEPMEADAPQEEPIPLSLTKDEPLELEVPKDEPLELLVAKDEPLELSVPREEPLELKVSKEDEPLELKVSKEDGPLELKVSKEDGPLELKVSRGDEPLELKVTSDQDEPLQLTQDEPLELKVKSPSEVTVVNGNQSEFLPLTNGIVNGSVVNGNGLGTSQDDEEMETEDLPPLKELSAEELQEKERRIRKLRHQLEEEEMKLVLLRKIRQSQILKENDIRIDGPTRDPSRVDGRNDSRSERSVLPPSSAVHHHSSQPSPHTPSVHGTIPGHLPAPFPPPSHHHSSRSSSHHGTNHLPPPSRHSMVSSSGHGHHSSMSGPPAHSGHHRLETSHDRHRVRDHGSRSSDPSRMSRSGVFNPPVPQIHARAHSGIPGHHGPPPGMTPAHSGHHSSRSSLPSSAVPAPAHAGHVRSTMPGSAVSSSSSRLPITTPPNVVVGYTPQGAPPPSAVKPERAAETPGQKLEKAKKGIRANLEKTLLNLPLPKVPTPEMHFVPNFNQLEFQYYMGLEAVVDILTDSPNIGKPPPDPFECFQCATDFTPVWKWQDVPDPKGSGRPAVICESCVTRNIKRAIRNDHTAKIKAAIQAASREEKEVEAKIAAGTYSPPSASPSLERVERLSSAPPPVVPPNVVVPMAAPSPPSIPSFVNSNVAHRSSREHRRDHGHHRDGGSSHGHHGHLRDPMIGSSAASSAGMIAPPAAHSSGSSSYSSARMSGDELGRRRERSPQVRDTGSSSMSSSAAAAAAAAASAAAVNAAAAQIFTQMQKMSPQQQALFLSQSLSGLGPMTNPQAMLSLAPLLLGQFGLPGLGAPAGTGSKSTSSNQMTPEQMQQRMFLEMMTNPSIAALGLPPQPGSGSSSRSSSHRDSSGYRNH